MKKSFYILLAVNLIVVTVFAFKKYNYGRAEKNQTSYYDQWNDIRRSIYVTLPVDSNDIVFVGDSQIECFPVTEIFGDSVKNRGIGGNKTSQLLQRLNEIVRHRPKKVFIEIGVNDIILANDPVTAFENYRKIIDTIQSLSPGTAIYVQSVLPVCYDYSQNNIAIGCLNANLIDYCKTKKITYIDLCSKMMLNDKLDSTLTIDGLHLNGRGYSIWRKSVEPYVK